MMAPRHILLIVLAFLAITETSTSSSSSDRGRRCGNLPTLSNGQVIRNGWNKIVYECNTGFRLSVMAECRRGKSWTPRVTCEEILCEGEPVIANGSLDTAIGSRSVGVEYAFTCDSGFKGMGKVVCNECGKWVGGEAECTECIASTNTFVDFNTRGASAADDAGCALLCASEPGCIVSYFSAWSCSFYTSPAIAVSGEPTLQDCIDACDANDGCEILQYTPNNVCVLLSLESPLTLVTLANYTLLGKGCPI